MNTLLLGLPAECFWHLIRPLTPLLLVAVLGLLTSSELPAQTSHRSHDHGLDYVQGPEYKVIDTPEGLRVFWRGEPLQREQARRTGEYEFVVLDDAGEDRLIIRLNEDETLDRVIDLKYADRPSAEAAPPEPEPEAAQRRQVEVVFKNGLIFRYENGTATAELPGVAVRLEGRAGRYRIYGPDFAAGVSFGRTDRPVYRYFSPKSD